MLLPRMFHSQASFRSFFLLAPGCSHPGRRSLYPGCSSPGFGSAGPSAALSPDVPILGLLGVFLCCLPPWVHRATPFLAGLDFPILGLPLLHRLSLSGCSNPSCRSLYPGWSSPRFSRARMLRSWAPCAALSPDVPIMGLLVRLLGPEVEISPGPIALLSRMVQSRAFFCSSFPVAPGCSNPGRVSLYPGCSHAGYSGTRMLRSLAPCAALPPDVPVLGHRGPLLDPQGLSRPRPVALLSRMVQSRAFFGSL